MATNTAGSSAREIHGLQVVHTLRKTVAYNTPGIGTADTVLLGVVPAGARLMPCIVDVNTAFNAGTTNVFTVGSNAGSDNNIVGSGDVNEAATGGTQVLTGLGVTFAADTPIYIRYTQTGTAASAGEATVILPFVPNNDG